MANFSPGPWQFEITDEGYMCVRMDDSHSVGWDMEGTGQCCFDNLYLGAAAPDLFESLVEVVNNLELAVHEGIESIARNLEPDEIDKMYNSIKLARIRLQRAQHSDEIDEVVDDDPKQDSFSSVAESISARFVEKMLGKEEDSPKPTFNASLPVLGPVTQQRWLETMQRQIDAQQQLLDSQQRQIKDLQGQINILNRRVSGTF